MRLTLFITLLLSHQASLAQSYDYYPTGDTTDVVTQTQAGTCLMGGATEHDNAMVWFLSRAGGGNILVIRASGSDGYNDYMYSQLGLSVQSVETIVFNSPAAANEPFVLDRISKAEAIWIAGGDQWDYVSYWRDSPVGQLLNEHALVKGAPIGGTSAGMAIAGGVYFSAENGTITSAAALANPYDNRISLGYGDFLHLDFLGDVITDTHYDDPDRRGRHMAFLARMVTDQGLVAKGIACDEYTAVCIDETGHARCYGEYPAYDEDIYFLQINCEAPDGPELCEPQSALNWNQDMTAVKVYRVKGTLAGTNSFELSDWTSGEGGDWEHWWVADGQLMTSDGTAADCSTGLEQERQVDAIHHYDRARGVLSFEAGYRGLVTLVDLQGRIIYEAAYTAPINIPQHATGLIILRYSLANGSYVAAQLLSPKH